MKVIVKNESVLWSKPIWFSLFLVIFFSPAFVFAQQTNAELAEIVKQIQEAVVRGASPEELTGLQKKLINAQISQSLEVKITPEFPLSNQDVVVEIISYQTDLQRAKTTWQSAGKTVASGFGITKQTFRTKKAGEKITITVSIQTKEGFSFIKNISLNPQDLEMYWEASTYTPPFYRGKALPAPRSKIKIVAFPDFVNTNKSKISSDDLVYIWRAQNGTILEQGYGKMFAYTTSPEGVGFERPVDVEVSSFSNSLRSKKRFLIKSFSPVVHLYEDNPILGVMYNKTLSKDIPLLKDELTIRAEPFYFSKEQSEMQKLVYGWLQNGKNISGETGPGITFRRELGEETEMSGSSRVDFSAKNPENFFESATRSFIIHFTDTL